MGYPETDSAVERLVELDPVMGAHIRRIGPCDITPAARGVSNFEALAREITFQQLAGKAAQTIWGRTRLLVKGRFTADSVLALEPEVMRTAGLSNNKMLAIRDLAQHVHDGRLPFARFARMTDEEVIESLIAVRGIGRWTAEMFLIFRLYRLNVWPVGDLGVRNGYTAIYGLDELPSVKDFAGLGNKFAPYRSIAAWYCWRAVDVVLAD